MVRAQFVLRYKFVAGMVARTGAVCQGEGRRCCCAVNPSLLYYKRKDSLWGCLFNLAERRQPMQRDNWRKVLKLRVLAQTIAAIISAIAAIHQLLKK